MEVGAEYFEVGDTIAKEPLNIIVLPLEDLQGLEEDGFDPQEGGIVIGFSDGAGVRVWWCPLGWGSWD